MRIKLAVAFAVLLLASVARADSTPIAVDATATGCQQCPQQFASVDLELQFTVELVAGNFFDSGFDYIFSGAVYEVVALTGTLNENAVALAAAPLGDGSWLYEDGNGAFQLGTVYFSDGDNSGWLENDGYSLLEGGGVGSGNTGIEWSAFDPPSQSIPTPEPRTYLLLGIGLCAIVGLFSAAKRVGDSDREFPDDCGGLRGGAHRNCPRR
jgi:hypothetical protein